MTTGCTTISHLDPPDAPDVSVASNNIDKILSTPIRAGKKRAWEATPPAPSRQKPSGGGPTKNLPQWTAGPIPFPVPKASKAAGQGQLGKSIRAAFETKAKKLSEAGMALAELDNYISSKIRDWEKAGLTEALGLGREISNVVKKYCENLNSSNRSNNCSNVTNNNKGSSQSWAHIAANTSDSEAQKSKKAESRKPTDAPTARVFVRLPQEHRARAADPYATLQKLRAELPESVSKGIKGVQAVPTGLAITLKDSDTSAACLEAKEKIESILEGAEVELEQKWAVFIIPDTPRSYKDYLGGWQQITEQQAKEEFKLQTGIQPLKLYWAKAQEQRSTGTLVLAVNQDLANQVPRWISLFGIRKPIIHKVSKPRIQQCKRCWGFHNERTCTRKQRCRLCGSKDHMEEGHKHIGPAASDCNCPSRCTNCRGPHSAEDIGCPIRPHYDGGIIQHKTKAQKEAIRKAQSVAFYAKLSACICKEKHTLDEMDSQIEQTIPVFSMNNDAYNHQANTPTATTWSQW